MENMTDTTPGTKKPPVSCSIYPVIIVNLVLAKLKLKIIIWTLFL